MHADDAEVLEIEPPDKPDGLTLRLVPLLGGYLAGSPGDPQHGVPAIGDLLEEFGQLLPVGVFPLEGHPVLAHHKANRVAGALRSHPGRRRPLGFPVELEFHAYDLRFLDFRQQHRYHEAGRDRGERKPVDRDEDKKFKQDSPTEISSDKDVEESKTDGNNVEVETEEKQKDKLRESSTSSKPYLEDEEGTPLDISDL